MYVAISLEGIKKAEVSKQGTTEDSVAQNSRSAIISIAELIKKINPSSTFLTKYIPKSLLNEKQIEALEKEKIKITEENKNDTQTNDNTLITSVIDYMSANGYDLDAEVNRVIKKFNPYILEHRARLNSSLLSEQSLQREIAADFLTSVFSNETVMQKLTDTDIERTKADEFFKKRKKMPSLQVDRLTNGTIKENEHLPNIL